MIQDDLDLKAKELAKEQRMRWHLAEIQKRREEDAARTIIGLVFTFAAVAMLYWIWGITR